MADWEDEMDQVEQQVQKTNINANSNDDDWENELTEPVQSTTVKSALIEEEEIVVRQQKVYVENKKNIEKEEEDDPELKWQRKQKKKIQEEEQMLQALEGLDEKTKQEKIQELKRIAEANLFEEDEDEITKLSSFNYKTQKLEVEKDFVDLATKVAAMLKAKKKHSFFYAFLKKVNLTIAAEMNQDLKHELISFIKIIQNRKKQDSKVGGKKDPVKQLIAPKTTKRMELDVKVEINPDYVPRNAMVYDDFM